MGTFIRKPNKVLEVLKKGEVPLGMQMYSHDPDLIEIVGYAGFDYVKIDMEHSRVNPETMVMLIRTAEAAGLTPLVRVGENNRLLIRSAWNRGPKAWLSLISRPQRRRRPPSMHSVTRQRGHAACALRSVAPTILRTPGKSTWPIPMRT